MNLAPVFESGSSSRPASKFTCSQRNPRISPRRAPVKISNRVAATAASLVTVALVFGVIVSTAGFVEASSQRDRALVAEQDQRLERERAEEHRATDRCQQAPADALDDPERHELFERLGEAAQDRDDHEQDEGDNEDSPRSEAVAQPSSDGNGRREAEEVADRDPFDVRAGDAELVGQGRQRDVDHRAVDHGHEDDHDVDDHHLCAVLHVAHGS